ncbi:MAG: prenyltransferase/squalene oxidase repeat-containing protein [Pirellulales bacterium]|nr:prenyltransferase/squalene oxidase repeat-containing protein [Pirellulales bacterium]
MLHRRQLLQNTLGALAAVSASGLVGGLPTASAYDEKQYERIVNGGCDWIAKTQSNSGGWTGAQSSYPTAMTALAGMALICHGSTTTQGKYSGALRKCVDYLCAKSRSNGLIGDPKSDDRYTYGHGYAMMFLSQVLGEEEDIQRRQELTEVLKASVKFCIQAQTSSGGWGYVSAKEGGDFDEGSTTITQVQGLRGCRNAGIPVPKEAIDKAIKYIQKCTLSDGGVQYSAKTGGGGRPPISAAAIACLYNAGDYDDKLVPKMLEYVKKHYQSVGSDNDGHWHYAHYYYAQVVYREGGKLWQEYRDKMYVRLMNEAKSDGKVHYWDQGYIGPIYTTSINLTILQLEKAYLPLYQR